MTTARLGALMINAGRPADEQKLDPPCQCCGAEEETDEHVIIHCSKLEEPRQSPMNKVARDQWRKSASELWWDIRRTRARTSSVSRRWARMKQFLPCLLPPTAVWRLR
jgi:hypothetical protein